MNENNSKSKTAIKTEIIQTLQECSLKSFDFDIFPQF